MGEYVLSDARTASAGPLILGAMDHPPNPTWQAKPTIPDDEQEPPVPTGFILAQNHSNHLRGMTTIVYGLAEAIIDRLSVCDTSGREVQALVYDHQKEGWHEAVSDGTNKSGHLTGSGLCFSSPDGGEEEGRRDPQDAVRPVKCSEMPRGRAAISSRWYRPLSRFPLAP